METGERRVEPGESEVLFGEQVLLEELYIQELIEGRVDYPRSDGAHQVAPP